MQTLTEIRALLNARGIAPKHRLGQNFLHDHNQLRKLIAAAQVGPDQCVLEVGPGTGALTEVLLESGARVIVCEIDDDMADIIQERLLPRYPDTLRLIRGDCLAGKHALNPAIMSHLRHFGATGQFKLVANLPYQVASPLLADLLVHDAACDSPTRCIGMYVTVQKEAAQRIMAQPGNREYGTLSVLCQVFAKIEQIATLPPTCFWPVPAVTSAMIAITPRARNSGGGAAESVVDGARYVEDDDDPVGWNSDRRMQIARTLTFIFSQRRKQIGTILRSMDPAMARPDLTGVVNPEMRPEQIPVLTLLNIASRLSQVHH